MNKLCKESRIFFFLRNISFLLLCSREDSRSGTMVIILEDIINKLLYFTEALNTDFHIVIGYGPFFSLDCGFLKNNLCRF